MIVRNIGHEDLDPLGHFSLIEHRWPEAGGAEVVLVGENSTAIGWIPLYTERDQLPECFLKEAWTAKDSSIPLLLMSGNHDPYDDLGGPGGLRRFAIDHGFRAMVSIDQPSLFLNAEGEPVTLQFLARLRLRPTIGLRSRSLGQRDRFGAVRSNTLPFVSPERHSLLTWILTP